MVSRSEQYLGDYEKAIIDSINEYMFRLKAETSDYELIHKADKIYFIGSALPEPYRMLLVLEHDIEENEENVLLGI